MSTLSLVTEALAEAYKPFEAAQFVVVPTATLYPSNSGVMIYIEGGNNSFVLSDGGGALACVLAAGGLNVKAKRFLQEVASKYGLEVNGAGWIYSRPVERSGIAAAVCLVAHSSQAAARSLIRHFRPGRHSDFRRELDLLLGARFESHLERKGKLLGASNKPQTFDYVVKANREQFAIDAVVPDQNSINAAIVAHVDVRNAGILNLRQFIVYDNRLLWRASDLSLLRVGATPIEYTEIEHALPRLAA